MTYYNNLESYETACTDAAAFRIVVYVEGLTAPVQSSSIPIELYAETMTSLLTDHVDGMISIWTGKDANVHNDHGHISFIDSKRVLNICIEFIKRIKPAS